MHHLAGSLLWGLDETSVDPHIFCVLSYHSLVWWNHGGRVHGPLSCGSREAAFEPAGLARAIWKLDHGRQHPGAGSGSVREIFGDGCGHGPCGGNPEWAASSSGIHAVHYRWILFGGLDMRYCSAAGCLTTQIADELWRAEHLSAAIGHASGARPPGGKIMNARTKVLV